MQTKIRYVLLLAVTAAAFSVYAGSLDGEFIYDDKRQILMNDLIQKPSLYGKALSSDVWAFKADGNGAGSNYYRPVFVLWMIINFALFGPDPYGWHVLSVLLHVAASVAAFIVLRRFGADDVLAFSIALIFAVHPVHVESVAWISGAPDLLFTLFMLGSLTLASMAVQTREKGFGKFTILSLAAYALALGSKEIGILCAPLFWMIFANTAPEESSKPKPPTPANRIIPYIVVAAAFFAARFAAIGTFMHPNEDKITFIDAVFTAPSSFIFYLRQMILPTVLSPNYPLRIVTEPGISNFFVPLVTSAAALYILWTIAKRSFVGKLGFGIFVLTLLPVLNSAAFWQEQVVHDRYLYLPLLGFLMVLLPEFYGLLQRIVPERASAVLAAVCIVASAALSYKTVAYTNVWHDDLSLWQAAVAVDPNSGFSWSQLGAAQESAGDHASAAESYGRSLDARPTALGFVGAARNLVGLGKFAAADEYAARVTESQIENVNAYTLFQAYEARSMALANQNKLADAEKLLTQARARLPIYSAALTEKLAVVLYLQGRKNETLTELESYRDKARREMLPASKSVFYRLGMLYSELGRTDEAVASLREYLASTLPSDKLAAEDRKAAAALLQRLTQGK